MTRRWMFTPALALVALTGALALSQLQWAEPAEAGVIAVSDAEQPVEAPLVAPPVAEEEVAVEVPVEEPVEVMATPRDVDLVIALDTSGSMSGLIDSTRNRVWDIVNEVNRLEEGANLRVALVTFGTPSYGVEGGFVDLQGGLTDDLDGFYARLMAVSTDGGDEYVGWTLSRALNELEWSSQREAAHIVFVAGNESADQARERFDFRTVAAQAVERGVVVNAIYAGAYDQGVREHWKAVADAGQGMYTAIDQSHATQVIETPQDAELARLNQELNGTYIPYGAQGQAGLQQMQAQDANASGLGVSALASRIGTKGTAVYKTEKWDLVEAAEKGTVDVGELGAEQLPLELQGLSEAERAQRVEQAVQQRRRLKSRIQTLAAERGEYLQEQREATDEVGLDDSMLEALGYQL